MSHRWKCLSVSMRYYKQLQGKCIPQIKFVYKSMGKWFAYHCRSVLASLSIRMKMAGVQRVSIAECLHGYTYACPCLYSSLYKFVFLLVHMWTTQTF